MKKTLLIITLFIGFGNINAQDASNDATWEETISFLNKYSDYFKSSSSHESYKSWEEEISFSNNFFIRTIKWKKDAKNRNDEIIWMNKVFFERKINLSKLTKDSYSSGNSISISTVGYNISFVRIGKRYLYDDKEWIDAYDLTDSPSVTNTTSLSIDDKEMVCKNQKSLSTFSISSNKKT
jgi:hypothetical protein